jgi:hypothetical protein
MRSRTTLGAQKNAKMLRIRFAQTAEKHISFHNPAPPAWFRGNLCADRDKSQTNVWLKVCRCHKCTRLTNVVSGILA